MIKTFYTLTLQCLMLNDITVIKIVQLNRINMSKPETTGIESVCTHYDPMGKLGRPRLAWMDGDLMLRSHMFHSL